MKLDVTKTFKDMEGNIYGTTTHAIMVLENDYTKVIIDQETNRPKIVPIVNTDNALTAGIAVSYSLEKLEVKDQKADMEKYSLIQKIKGAKKTVEVSDDDKNLIGEALFSNKGLTTSFRGDLLSSIK